MNKVMIFLDSGQTVETYLDDGMTNTMIEGIKNTLIGNDVSKTILVETDKTPELIVSTKNIVAVKVIWDAEV